MKNQNPNHEIEKREQSELSLEDLEAVSAGASAKNRAELLTQIREKLIALKPVKSKALRSKLKPGFVVEYWERMK